MVLNVLADGGVKMGLPQRLAVRLGAQALLVSIFPLYVLDRGVGWGFLLAQLCERVGWEAGIWIGDEHWAQRIPHKQFSLILPSCRGLPRCC